VLFPFKCGLASEAGLRHLSRNKSGGSATQTPLGSHVAHLEQLRELHNKLKEEQCHTRFWKANRMRTIYVSGSETHTQ
jgi:hypothetical protein